MTKHPTTTLLAAATIAAFAIAAAAGPSSTEAQDSGSDATRVAAQVQAFYDQTRTVQTAFSQAHYDRIYRRTTRSRGVLTIARPGKLRFDYLGGDGKVVVSNGETLTVYEPDDHGGGGQFARTEVREEGIPSALSFLTGASRLDRDFSFRLQDAARFRWDGDVLELRPRRPEAAYRRVFLFVDGEHAGVVRRVLIQDHDGNINRFDFARMRFNRPVASSRFDFRPPASARRL